MSEFVIGKLKEWGLKDYIQIFIEQKISEESLMILDENDIKMLIPELGPRKIFLNKFQEMYEKKMSSEDPPGNGENTVRSTPECQNVQSTASTKYVNTTEVKLSQMKKCMPSTSREHKSTNGYSIREYLNKTTEGKKILKKYDRKTWSNIDRNKFATLIINKELKISSQRFVELRAQIIREFPKESAETYYVPPGSNKDTGKKTSQTGKLYNQYTRSRPKLVKRRVVNRTPKRKSTQITSSLPQDHMNNNPSTYNFGPSYSEHRELFFLQDVLGEALSRVNGLTFLDEKLTEHSQNYAQ